MKVYIQKHDHGMYKDLLEYPPVEYKFVQKILLDKLIYQISYPRIAALRFGIRDKKSLIHVHQALVKDKVPWVVDQSEAQLFIDSENYYKLTKHNYIRAVEKYLNSKYCKKIMPTSNAAKENIRAFYDIKEKDKIEVVYPAIHKEKVKKREHEKIKLLFVSGNRSTNFYVKGGSETFKAFEILDGRYDVTLTYIGLVPEDIKEKYSERENINIYPPQYSQHELFEVYKNHDIFLMPTYTDCFGYVILEAISCELPVIATNMYAIPEILGEEERGLLIDAKKLSKCPFGASTSLTKWRNWSGFVEWIKNADKTQIVKELIEKTSLLIEDSSMMEKIRRNQKKEVESGKFSIKERNKKLKRIYEEAIE